MPSEFRIFRQVPQARILPPFSTNSFIWPVTEMLKPCPSEWLSALVGGPQDFITD